MSEKRFEREPSANNSPDAFFSRHSASYYQSYAKHLESDNPTGPFDVDRQVVPDLPEKGVKIADEAAEKFFEKLNPERDAIFFVSSDESRALGTANVYRQKAHSAGFEVIKPEKAGAKIADEIGAGEIRTVRNLSLHSDNLLRDTVFTPAKQLTNVNINWGAVDEETHRKWDQAKAIVDGDDQGSWGANLAKHANAIKEIFPDVQTPEELYNTQFRKLTRLLKWGVEKAKSSGHPKNIKIVAFGHENYLLHALEKYFDEQSIGNCEMMALKVDDDKISGEYRGKSAELGK